MGEINDSVKTVIDCCLSEESFFWMKCFFDWFEDSSRKTVTCLDSLKELNRFWTNLSLNPSCSMKESFSIKSFHWMIQWLSGSCLVTRRSRFWTNPSQIELVLFFEGIIWTWFTEWFIWMTHKDATGVTISVWVNLSPTWIWFIITRACSV